VPLGSISANWFHRKRKLVTTMTIGPMLMRRPPISFNLAMLQLGMSSWWTRCWRARRALPMMYSKNKKRKGVPRPRKKKERKGLRKSQLMKIWRCPMYT